MKIDELFAITKERWPSEMDVSKAELLPDGGFRCWEQIRIEEKISKSFKENTGLLAAAIWPFHQALSQISRELYSSGRTTVSPDDVRIRDFERYLLSALSEDSWALEREEYLKHN